MLQITSSAARGLLRAIIEDPADDVPRLLLADVLEEAWEGERASFIRVQCELAHMAAPWCKADARENNCEELGLSPLCDWCALRHRERELLKQQGDLRSWIPEPVWQIIEAQGYVGYRTWFRRGFVSSVTLTCADWCGEVCRRCNGQRKIPIPPRRTDLGIPMVPPMTRCPQCHGIGRTGRHGPALVLAAPIEEGVLSDREPYHTFAGWWGWRRQDQATMPAPDVLPGMLFDLLEEPDVIASPVGGYNTREKALLSLSRSALAWARQEAGLPALTRWTG